MQIDGASREHVSLLGTLIIRSAGVLQVASVRNSDLVADLGDRARAVLENSLGNTHDCGCA